LPFSDSVDITEATTEPGELQFCTGSPQTVWYSFTPSTDGAVRVDTAGSSSFDTVLTAYRASGPSLGGLSFLRCAFFGNAVTFAVDAGTTYYVQAGKVFSGGGVLQINLQEVPRPSNDAFADATPITTLPFVETVDTSAATTEPGEPTPSCSRPPSATVWYALTPSTTGSVSAHASSGGSTVLAAYTGSSLTTLTELSCRPFTGSVLTLHVNAGTTYYFQVDGFGSVLQFGIEVTPPPVAGFSFGPSDPSIFDTVHFFDNSFDPGGLGIESQAWDFGDGATAMGCCPTHRYAADGAYTVRLTVTTVDGRTASTSQVVQVRTHDVAITKFTAPQAAKAGQTRQITVDVNNTRYPETVQVQLFRSVAGGGFQEIGNLTQSVPVRGANRTTPFSINYTFTSDDAAIGKVTFKAVANLVSARDALPADNEAIASPTKVSH
jgi:hypothetical protein